MSDDISIPHPSTLHQNPVLQGPYPARTSFTHSYRARRTGMDAGTKRLFMAAGALGFILVAGMGAWSLTGQRAAGIPVIEADIRPLRVKPENPGGMTAIGANEQMMSGSGAGDVADLAPPAEKPDPQALMAQRPVTVTPSSAPADPAMPATPAPVTRVAAPGSNVTPVPDPKAPTVQVAPQAGAPVRPAGASTAATGIMVQIASVDSEQGATAEWQRLTKKMPDLLGDRRPVMQRAELAGKAVWRIRTGGFADIAEATQFCARVRAKGAGCSIANF